MLVITGKSVKDGEKLYLGTDHASGGYSYWSGSLLNARPFKNKEQARAFLDNNSEFNRIGKMGDGSISLPRMFEQVLWDSINIEEVITNSILVLDFSDIEKEYLMKKKKYEELKNQMGEI